MMARIDIGGYIGKRRHSWSHDIAPVRTLGSVLALVSGLGAMFGVRHGFLIGSTYDFLSTMEQRDIGIILLLCCVFAILFPRTGAIAATGAFCFERIFQTLQSSSPVLLVIVAWVGLFGVAIWEVAKDVSLRNVLRNFHCSDPKGWRWRLACALLNDTILFWGAIHTAWFGFCIAQNAVWSNSPNLWISLSFPVAITVGSLMVIFSLFMLSITTPHALFTGAIVGALMRLVQSIQVESLYTTGFWIIVLVAFWWALHKSIATRAGST